jgi:pyridoxal phosphate enzyme (YggS family)
MTSIADNLQAIRARLGPVILLAVSKGQSTDAVRQAAAAGQKAFGENYVQEGLEKMTALPGLEWHLIGPLQSNKTRVVAARFDWVQTVASERIARRLSEQRPGSLPPLNVLIQVNVSAESTKSGVAPGEVKSLAKGMQALKGIRLRGLMAIPEPGADRSRHAEARKIFDQLKGEFALDTLSIGMSDDMDTAIAEGSTMVRIGSAIFGKRSAAAKVKSAA